MDNNTFFIYGNNVEAKSVEDKDKKRYFIKGYVSTGDVDLVNDVVSFDCIKEMDKQIKSRSLKLDLDHETLRASLKSDREDDIKFNLTKIPLGKAIDSNFDSKGNIVEFELNDKWKKFDSKGNVVMTFEDVWDNINNGYYDSFSIAYVPLSAKSVKKGNGIIRQLDRVNLLNVALTGTPVNPMATMSSVMMKSLDVLEDFDDIDIKSIEIKSLDCLEDVRKVMDNVRDLCKGLK